MKFEDALAALKNGKKIKRKPWKSDQYICLENGDNLPIYYVLEDDWEIVEGSESTYDWDYIIKNKCLCWFWDREDVTLIKYLTSYGKDERYPFVGYSKGDGHCPYKHCRPVRKEEVTFYEDKEDEDNS